MMAEVRLTREMADALRGAMAAVRPAQVATAGASGMPDVAFKGSIMVLDDDHIAFWERAHGTTLKNLQENPQAAVLFWNPAARQAFKFFGEAELVASGSRRMEVLGKTIQLELDRDPERKGVAVIIRVDKVVQMGQVTMERGSGG